MTSKEKVLSVYPDAFCSQIYDGDEPPVVIGYTVYRDGGIGPKLSNKRRTEAEAWDAAASKLPSAPSPAGAKEKRCATCNSWASQWCGKGVGKGQITAEHVICFVPTTDAVPEPVSTEGLPSSFGQMIGNLKVPPIVEALGPLTERDLLGFASESAAPIAPAADELIQEASALIREYERKRCKLQNQWPVMKRVYDFLTRAEEYRNRGQALCRGRRVDCGHRGAAGSSGLCPRR